MRIMKKLIPVMAALSLTACGTLFEKDNTPEPKTLAQFNPEITPRLLWSTSAGSGTGDEYLKATPAVTDSAIYTASLNGKVTSVDRANGQVNWRTNTDLALTSGAGAGDGIVVAGSREGDVVALSQRNGQPLWKVSVPGEVNAAPAVSNGLVIVKTVSGHVSALNASNGEKRWSYQQVEPNLILRAASMPRIADGHVFIGFANGNLSNFRLNEGQLIWSQTITYPEGAFAIQRMIDIDADPVIYGHRIYAATYQGKIAALDWNSGNVQWTHDISSYTGMSADTNNIYISDAKSYVWSFNADSGAVNWRQTDLEWRNISGPATMGNYIVVGDAKGFVHWLSASDGHFVGRTHIGGSIYSSPIVRNGVVYVLNSSGNLSAYTLS